jgi:hypothetical protein
MANRQRDTNSPAQQGDERNDRTVGSDEQVRGLGEDNDAVDEDDEFDEDAEDLDEEEEEGEGSF